MALNESSSHLRDRFAGPRVCPLTLYVSEPTIRRHLRHAERPKGKGPGGCPRALCPPFADRAYLPEILKTSKPRLMSFEKMYGALVELRGPATCRRPA